MPEVVRREVVIERSITGVSRVECNVVPGARENVVVCYIRTGKVPGKKPPHAVGNLRAAFFVNNTGTAMNRRMVAEWPRGPATCLVYSYAERPVGGGPRRALFSALLCGIDGTDEFEKLKETVERWMYREARELGE